MINRFSCFFLLLLLPSFSQADKQYQSLDEIEMGAKQFLTLKYQHKQPQSRATINVDKLDSRLKLTPCGQPLTYNLPNPDLRGGRVTVQVRCPGSQSWSLYVPARIELLETVVVATRDLLRGARLQAGDIELQQRQSNRLSNSSAKNIEGLIGKQLRRNVHRGDVIRLTTLIEPVVVKRGDYVSLEAKTGAISVVTRGTALSDGRIGEQIRVKNNKSERIVRAVVTDSGKVAVLL